MIKNFSEQTVYRKEQFIENSADGEKQPLHYTSQNHHYYTQITDKNRNVERSVVGMYFSPHSIFYYFITITHTYIHTKKI